MDGPSDRIPLHDLVVGCNSDDETVIDEAANHLLSPLESHFVGVDQRRRAAGGNGTQRSGRIEEVDMSSLQNELMEASGNLAVVFQRISDGNTHFIDKVAKTHDELLQVRSELSQVHNELSQAHN